MPQLVHVHVEEENAEGLLPTKLVHHRTTREWFTAPLIWP